MMAAILKLLLGDSFNKLCYSSLFSRLSDGIEEEIVDLVLQQFMTHLEVMQKTLSKVNLQEKFDPTYVVNLYSSILVDLQKLTISNLQFYKVQLAH